MDRMGIFYYMYLKEIFFKDSNNDKSLGEKILFGLANTVYLYNKYSVNILLALLEPIKTYNKIKLNYIVKNTKSEINTTYNELDILNVINSKITPGIIYEIRKPTINDLKELPKLPFEIGIYKCKDKWFMIKGIDGLIDFSMLTKIFTHEDIQLNIHSHPYIINNKKLKNTFKKILKNSSLPPYYCLFPSYADIASASHYKFNNTYIATKFGIVRYQSFNKKTLDKIFIDYQLFKPIRLMFSQWKKDFETIMVKWQYATDILTYSEFEKIINQ